MFGKLIQLRKYRKHLKDLVNGITYRLDCDDDILDAGTKAGLQDLRAELKKYAARRSLSDLPAVANC